MTQDPKNDKQPEDIFDADDSEDTIIGETFGMIYPSVEVYDD